MLSTHRSRSDTTVTCYMSFSLLINTSLLSCRLALFQKDSSVMQNFSSVNNNEVPFDEIFIERAWFHMKTCLDKGRNANLKKLKSRRLLILSSWPYKKLSTIGSANFTTKVIVINIPNIFYQNLTNQPKHVWLSGDLVTCIVGHQL